MTEAKATRITGGGVRTRRDGGDEARECALTEVKPIGAEAKPGRLMVRQGSMAEVKPTGITG